MNDTIAAIATAYGEGGIGIIRISGEKSKDILDGIFMPVSKHRTGGSREDENKERGNEGRELHLFLPAAVGETIGAPIVNRRLTYGEIIEPTTGQIMDEVLAVYMKAPYTYTMEDVVEINCHGGVVALRNVLSLCLKMGARLAEPGEFTKRAFLNGRIDLSQAEAVIDIVRAKTDFGFKVALNQMEGGLSREIEKIRGEVLNLLVQITVNLDYSEEDIEEITCEGLIKSLLLIDDELDKILQGAHTGRLLREGLAVTIAGRPNVGKSSLMNAFLKESRAIVTEIPGTTRDTIEEALSISGIPVRLTDTAGIRKTEDKIEQIGIEKSKEAVNKADLILFMVSGNEPLRQEDKEIIPYLEPQKTIVLLNKKDLGLTITKADLEKELPGSLVLETSMQESTGLLELEEAIGSMVFGGKVSQEDSLLITNIRHSELLRKAKEEIEEACRMARQGEALDFIEINIRAAFDYLGEIIGETVSDEIINEVFARFCLGK